LTTDATGRGGVVIRERARRLEPRQPRQLLNGWNHAFGGGKIAGTTRWFASIGRASRPRRR